MQTGEEIVQEIQTNLTDILEKELIAYTTELVGKSGKSAEWEAGFVEGIKYVKEHWVTKLDQFVETADEELDGPVGIVPRQ